MSSNIQTGVGSSPDFSAITSATDLQQIQTTQKANFADKITNIGNGQTKPVDYTNPPNIVSLPPSDGKYTLDDVPSFLNGMADKYAEAGQTLASFFNPATMQAFADGLDQSTNYVNSFDSEMEKLSEEEQVQVNFAINHPDAPVSPKIRALANQVISNARSSLPSDSAPPNWHGAMKETIQDAAVQYTSTSSMAAYIENSGVSPEDARALMFANEHPEALSALSPELQSILKDAKTFAAQQMQSIYGLDQMWELSPDGTSPEVVKEGSDNGFQKLLYEKVNNGEITEAQSRELLTLHYQPDAKFTPSAFATPEEQQQVLQSMHSEVMNELQPFFGFPSGYQPAANSKKWSNFINSKYETAFNASLDQMSPPLTESQKQAVRDAFGKPEADLPLEIQALLKKANAMAIEKLGQNFALPDGWQASLAEIREPRPNDSSRPGSLKMIQNMLNVIKEHTASAESTLSGLPASPATGSYMDYLKVINSALSLLTETLAGIEINNGRLAVTLDMITYDMSIIKIQKQQASLKAQMEQMEKAQKGGFMGVLMKSLNFILQVIICVLTCGAGFILWAKHIADGGDPFSFDVINATVAMLAKIVGPKLAGIVMLVAVMILAIVLSCIPLVGNLMATALLAAVLLDVCFGDGQWMTDMMVAWGIPESAAGWITMVIQIAVQIIVEIIISLVIFVFTCGAGAEASIAIIMAGIAEITAELTFELTLTALKTAVQVAVKVVVYLLKILVKALIKAIVEAVKEAVKSVVKMVKDLQKLGKMAFKAMTKADEILETVTKAGEKAITKIDDLIETIKKAGDDAFDYLSALKRDTSGTVGGSARKFGNKVVDGFRDFVESYRDAYKTLQESKQTWREAREALKEARKLGDDELIRMAEKNVDDAVKGLQEAADHLDNLSFKIVQEMADRFQQTMMLAQGITGMAQGIQGAYMQMILAKLARIKGEFEAWLEVFQQILDQIKALVQLILTNLGEIGDWMNQVIQQQSQMWRSNSAAMSSLAAASA